MARGTVRAVAVMLAASASAMVMDREGWLAAVGGARDALHALGPRAAPVYGAAYAALVAAGAPLLTVLLECAAGVAFGFAHGAQVVVAGKIAGCVLAFALGRTLLRDTMGNRAKGHPRFGVLYNGVRRDGWYFVLLARLAPIPSWLNNYGLAVTEVRFFPDFLLPTALGVLPSILLNVHAGLAFEEVAALPRGRPLDRDTLVSCIMPLWAAFLVTRAIATYAAMYEERIESEAPRFNWDIVSEPVSGGPSVLTPREKPPPPPATRHSTRARKPSARASPAASPAASPSPPRSRAKSTSARSGARSATKSKTPAPKKTAAAKKSSKASTRSLPARSPSPKATPRRRVRHGAGADINNDGHTTRSEAHAARIQVTAMDLNDDGRTTRSEAAAYRRAKKKGGL